MIDRNTMNRQQLYSTVGGLLICGFLFAVFHLAEITTNMFTGGIHATSAPFVRHNLPQRKTYRVIDIGKPGVPMLTPDQRSAAHRILASAPRSDDLFYRFTFAPHSEPGSPHRSYFIVFITPELHPAKTSRNGNAVLAKVVYDDRVRRKPACSELYDPILGEVTSDLYCSG